MAGWRVAKRYERRDRRTMQNRPPQMEREQTDTVEPISEALENSGKTYAYAPQKNLCQIGRKRSFCVYIFGALFERRTIFVRFIVIMGLRKKERKVTRVSLIGDSFQKQGNILY